MRRRMMPYTVCLLLAAVLALIPTALAFDMVVPLDKWENWYWPGQPAPRPQFRFPNNLPPVLRAEMWLYRTLVTPPGAARKMVTGWSGNYALTFVSPGSSSEAWAVLPPAALALEHLQAALPFWFLSFAVLYELGAWIRRRRRPRVAVA